MFFWESSLALVESEEGLVGFSQRIGALVKQAGRRYIFVAAPLNGKFVQDSIT